MAIGDVTPKKLFQGAISATVTAKYTCPISYRAQVCEIWLANTGATDRTVTVYAHGVLDANIIANGIILKAGESKCLADNKIILTAAETLGFKQDVGTDINVTAYGYEEQVA